MDNHPKSVAGIYDTEQEAILAVEELQKQGYSTEDISVISKNREDVDVITEETGTKAGEGAATGAVAGGTLGGISGLLAGVWALAIPGIGPIVAAGPIGAALTGIIAGAGIGGLSGALIGMGIPEDEAKLYDESVKEGKILVLVDKKDDFIIDREKDKSNKMNTTPINGSNIRPKNYNDYEERDVSLNETDNKVNTVTKPDIKW
jgi:uncharacterized membrane protein